MGNHTLEENYGQSIALSRAAASEVFFSKSLADESNAVEGAASKEGHKFYTFFVEEKEFRTESPQLTGGEIMDMAGIPHSEGLVLIKEDNTQAPIGVNEIVEFEGPGRRFKKAPRFKRG